MAIIKVRDENGDVIDIPAFVGPKGDPGADYVLTEADKAEIAELAAELVDFPDSSQNVDLTGYAKEQWVQEVFQPKGDYALASAVPTKVGQLENDKGYLTQHQDISGKLDASKLPEAVNDALAQAKASGEFDGTDGKDGYSPVRGVDYWTDADIAEIVNAVYAKVADGNGVAY